MPERYVSVAIAVSPGLTFSRSPRCSLRLEQSEDGEGTRRYDLSAHAHGACMVSRGLGRIRDSMLMVRTLFGIPHQS